MLRFSPLTDVGINSARLLTSAPYALALFAVVTVIEAIYLSDFLELPLLSNLPFPKALWYSFVMNGVSTLIGIPVTYFFQIFLIEIIQLCILFLLLPFLLTLLLEHFMLYFILKPKLPWQKVLKAVIKLNVISYLALILLVFLYTWYFASK